MNIAYVQHPISLTEKKQYRREFDKIIDIKFAPQVLPDGSKVFSKKKEVKTK